MITYRKNKDFGVVSFSVNVDSRLPAQVDEKMKYLLNEVQAKYPDDNIDVVDVKISVHQQTYVYKYIDVFYALIKRNTI